MITIKNEKYNLSTIKETVLSTIIRRINDDGSFKLELSIDEGYSEDLNKDVETEIKTPKSGFEKGLLELVNIRRDNEELLKNISAEKEIELDVICEEENVYVKLDNQINWIKFIELVINEIESLKKLMNTERITKFCEEEKESKIENSLIPIQQFAYFYLVLKRIFLKNPSKKEVSITVNIYKQYMVKKSYIKDKCAKIVDKLYSEKEEKTNLDNLYNSYYQYLLDDKEELDKEKSDEAESIDQDDSFYIEKTTEELAVNNISKNILLKGVPGVGKSRAIDKLIEKVLNKNPQIDNILRINIHSGSSNSDLMQGVSVSTDKTNNIIYEEKQGLILNFIFNAIRKPDIPFFLVLEEIQENSLNMIIGDMIYLIENDKRVNVKDSKYSDKKLNGFKHIEFICNNNENINYVYVPNLITNEVKYRKLIIPDNLYVFCTTNYRGYDRIMEDNLFRRFEIIDVFPNSSPIDNDAVKDFFGKLNKEIANEMKEELHIDRYLIGQSNWINVEEEEALIKAMIKLINDFKEIKAIEFDRFKHIIKEIKLDEKNKDDLHDKIKEIIEDINKSNSYYSILSKLQSSTYEWINL